MNSYSEITKSLHIIDVILHYAIGILSCGTKISKTKNGLNLFTCMCLVENFFVSITSCWLETNRNKICVLGSWFNWFLYDMHNYKIILLFIKIILVLLQCFSWDGWQLLEFYYMNLLMPNSELYINHVLVGVYILSIITVG